MSINKRELQRFLDVWGPVITVLPAVINAAERETELEIHTQQLQMQLDKVKLEAVAAAEKAAEQNATAAAELSRLQAAKAVAAQEVSDAMQASKDSIAEVRAATDADIKQLNARVSAAKVLAQVAETEAGQILDAVNKKVAQREAELELMVAAAEKRVNDAEAALDKLRSKLG